MPTPMWIRRDTSDIQKAFQPIPSIQASSRKDFRPPPTLKSDFKRLLAHDIEHVNYNFE